MSAACEVYAFDIRSNTKDSITSYLSDNKIDASVYCGSTDGNSDALSLYRAVVKLAGISYFYDPIIVYLDKSGNIVSHSTGYVSEETLQKAVAQIVTLKDAPKEDDKKEDGKDGGLVSDTVYHIAAKGKLDVGALIKTALKDSSLTFSKYTVSDKKIASVSKKGILTGKKDGLVTVTAYSISGGKTIAAGSMQVQVNKPVFKFTKDLTYLGAKLDANDFISNLPDDIKVTWSVPSAKSPAVTLNSQTGVLTASKKGSVKVTCLIGEEGYAAKYTAVLKVKLPKIKESLTVKNGKAKTVTLSNVSKYTDVTWSLGSSSAAKALEIIPTKKGNVIKIKALQASNAALILTASVDGQKYTTTITVK